MGKVIRPRYSVEFSIGVLLLVFVLSFILAYQIFEIPKPELNDGKNIHAGVALISSAVIIMLLVLWEEFLFPVKVKSDEGGFIFRNHRNKLKTQLFIYCTIPIIFGMVYMMYEVNLIRFFIWAAICIIVPVAGKLISGIKNYNDFLKLSDAAIEYKNNEKSGVLHLTHVKQITLIKDERNVLHKIQVLMKDHSNVIIDLDEMELDAFIVAIESFVLAQYKVLLTEIHVVNT
jgi:hypothetical protein